MKAKDAQLVNKKSWQGKVRNAGQRCVQLKVGVTSVKHDQYYEDFVHIVLGSQPAVMAVQTLSTLVVAILMRISVVELPSVDRVVSNQRNIFLYDLVKFI